jgi:hypothetical protein
MQFGDMNPVDVKAKQAALKKAAAKRNSVKADGLEEDRHTRYDSEVAFANIRATANVTRVKDDTGPRLGVAKGAILEGVPITVPSNTAGATAHAMKKRCDHAPGVTNLEHFRKGHALLMSKVAQHDIIRVDETLVASYVRTCNPTKAERLMAAYRSGEYSWDGESKHVFAKQETLLKDHGAQPRIVYQGTDMYNFLTGCVVMEIQRRMKASLSHSNPLNTGNVVVFACGKSGEEIGDVIHAAPGEIIESDFSNNDGSQSAGFRKYEAMFYAKHGAPAWFVREFARNVQVRVWTRYGIEATVKGQRWSGETTTTTGNSYVGAVQLLACALEAGVTQSTHIHGGDDFLGIAPPGDAEKMVRVIPAVVASSGMEAKVFKAESRHHGTFYRKRYVSDKVRTRPVPQFGRVLAKINLRANQNTAVGDREYMAGKYYSAAYEHRYVPGIRELLLQTARQMSDKPHFDVRLTKMNEMGGVGDITRVVEESDAISLDSFSDFLRDVYGIGYEDLMYEYGRVADTCIGWLNQYTYVDKRGRGHSKSPPAVQKLGGQTIEALLARDV